jgi:hypothetical protein
MKNKDRVVIVSSYGNPLAINVWIKYYEKYWMDIVDKVYIVAGGELLDLQDKLIEANTKLCDHYNKKTNSNKLHFIYANDSSDRHTLSTHAHLLFNGTKYACMHHKDATLFYVDDDLFILDKNYIDDCFKKIESGEYLYGGQVTPRPSFGEKSHTLGWFSFCDLNVTRYLIEQYESSMNEYFSNIDISYLQASLISGEYDSNPKLKNNMDWVYLNINMFKAYIHQYGNIFGSIQYVPGINFNFINYVTDYLATDEVYWLFSKMTREHCGRDKEFVLSTKPEMMSQLYIHQHMNLDEQVDALIKTNPVCYHISGNYRQFNFCYKIPFEQICEELDRLDMLLKNYENYKLLVLIKLGLDCWDHDHIDTGEIRSTMQRYYDHVYTLPNLSDFLSKENIAKIQNVVMRNIQ